MYIIIVIEDNELKNIHNYCSITDAYQCFRHYVLPKMVGKEFTNKKSPEASAAINKAFMNRYYDGVYFKYLPPGREKEKKVKTDTGYIPISEYITEYLHRDIKRVQVLAQNIKMSLWDYAVHRRWINSSGEAIF